MPILTLAPKEKTEEADLRNFGDKNYVKKTASKKQMRARKAVGLFRNLEDAVEDMVTIRERLEPNPKNSKAYDKLYAKYVKLHESLIELFAID